MIFKHGQFFPLFISPVGRNLGILRAERTPLVMIGVLQVDCPRSGPGQVQGFFSGPGPGPPGPVQLMTGPGPGPHWTGSTRVGPGPGQVRTWT